MLTFEQIKEYFPVEVNRLNLKGMLVEYLQYEFLDSLFRRVGSEKLSFIGGTAIRFIYNSQRFSEDLDFDNFGLAYDGFKSLMEKACRDLKTKGFELEHRIFKKDEVFHVYLKFPSLLSRYGLGAHRLEKVFIAVDAQKKKKVIAPEVKSLNKFGIFRNIAVNRAPVLLAQKLMAILFRRRERGRDFYDASFLGGLSKPDYIYIEKTTAMKAEEFKEKLLKRCSRFDYSSLAKDVLPFLFNADQQNRVLDFRKTLTDIL